MTALEVFKQSQGAVTRSYYEELQRRGPIGIVALNLFRAQKTSSRAKTYRGEYLGMSYERKAYSMRELCKVLEEHGVALGIGYGWKEDPDAHVPWVLYVDLPKLGQVSFHALLRGTGPVYRGEWDRQHASGERIMRFCDQVMAMRAQDELVAMEGKRWPT